MAAGTGKLVRIAPDQLDGVLAQARAERWSRLVLLGSGIRLGERPEDWPIWLRADARVFQLTHLIGDLADRLRSLTGLTSLDLTDNRIGDDGARAIAASLTGLTLLNLWNNSIGDDGARAIAASLTGLTSLHLGYNSVGADGARAIAASLTGLTSLDLSGSSIGADGARAIAASLTGLTSLDLGHNSVGADGARAIAASLTGLTSLDLSNNSIGDDGAQAIAASLTGLTSLNLSDDSIGDDGARAIADSLTGLTSLDLSQNGIGDDGARAIADSLTGLTSLNLSGNSIGDDGARAIADCLTGLTSLDLRSNSIGDDGARAIADCLTGLTSLDLSFNSIGADGAQAIAASLTGLTSLDLTSNSIGADGARAIAASLTGLTSLNLRSNSIGADGVRVVFDAFVSRDSGALRRLDLRGNGELSDLLPKEVLESTDAQAILAAYRRFSAAAKAQDLRPLNELKLLVVGNEAVGKTSLLRFLIQGEPRDEAETRTIGIVQHEKIQVQPWSPDECQVQLNIWDFGGQEMLRGTHRFFLTERSLYLLVLEDRRQDDRSIYEWVKTIRNRGDNSPIIVVINKSDNGKQDYRPDEAGLQADTPNIVGFLRTSCDPDAWAAASIAALRQTIVRVAMHDPRLRHVRDGIPSNWLQLKNEVTAMADAQAVLTHANFVGLCRHPGPDVPPVTSDDEQRALLQLLHQLGTIVAHGLPRDASAARREVSLLDPNWLTDAVYTIVDRSRTVDQNGEFQRRQLAEWLDPRRYPPERHEFILDMMQDPDIGLCFRLPATREERYIVPEALPANRPYLGARPDNVLRFRFGYSYLPPGLIPRLIVESNRNLLPEMPRWRGGVMLATRDCEVLVLADADQRRVELEVSGPPALRRSALNVVLNDLDAVHALNPEAEPLALVPLPDQSDQQVRYEHLLELERRYGAEHSFLPEGSRREYTVRELLEGVRRDPGTALPRPSVARGCVVESQTHTVILVHGIRTTALWQSSVRAALEQQGFSVALTNYGRFDLFRFLCPGQFFRRRVVEEIARQLRHATRDAGGKCSVVAHSFGTFIIACILRDHTDIEFSRIIFCGSVVRHWFRFEDYRGRFEAPVINEVGTKDVLPVLAATTTTGYGSAGTFGFRRPGGVRDRWHNGVDHSAFLKPKFCRDFWVPYLRDGTIVEGDVEPQSPPWWIQIVAVAQPRWLVVMAGAAGLWWRFSPLLPAAW